MNLKCANHNVVTLDLIYMRVLSSLKSDYLYMFLVHLSDVHVDLGTNKRLFKDSIILVNFLAVVLTNKCGNFAFFSQCFIANVVISTPQEWGGRKSANPWQSNFKKKSPNLLKKK